MSCNMPWLSFTLICKPFINTRVLFKFQTISKLCERIILYFNEFLRMYSIK